ncbi:hypothetical protein [Streptomyces sp. NK08204]|uniref:hypothetical protein n=1 Tax=Streptomyces sp. NK08204 TaxID=2873260 RepID=UPI001CED6B40|nr:hypothetical protein [Streptomyces sp. NK08204]
MFRGTTARTVLTLLAATLLTLGFFAPTGSFTSAHTLSHARAKGGPVTTPPTKPLRDTADAFRAPSHPVEPVGTRHTRDRQRGSGSGWAQERPSSARPPAGPHPPAGSGGPGHGATRSSRTHSPAALQVFRC